MIRFRISDQIWLGSPHKKFPNWATTNFSNQFRLTCLSLAFLLSATPLISSDRCLQRLRTITSRPIEIPISCARFNYRSYLSEIVPTNCAATQYRIFEYAISWYMAARATWNRSALPKLLPTPAECFFFFLCQLSKQLSGDAKEIIKRVARIVCWSSLTGCGLVHAYGAMRGIRALIPD